ncbi:MAG: ArsR family transcriptional regulator [Ignavibacteriae bacterium]|nr:MAG: ArsR family transcriptional regulator [Ignavibacteriota bacterium]
MEKKILYNMHADVCKALAHELRIEIIDVLKDKELNFGEIAKRTEVAKSNLSQHLTVMVQKGILTHRKEGLYVYYKLSSPKVYKAFRIMREVLKERIHKQNELINKFK